jgi:DmsE family decaheme c-type cytochrome
MKGVMTLSVAVIICLGGACAYKSGMVLPVFPVPDATYVGSEECAVCHDDVFEYYRRTVHYKVRSFEVPGQERGCEGCHGPGSAHVAEKGNIQKIVRFDTLSSAQSSAICLQCHAQGPLMHWSSNFHALSDVGCDECHKSHKATAEKMLFKAEPELCYDCHQQMRAKAEFPSHHPIREGKMKCTGCHSTHGAERDALLNATVNDLCYDCHTDKQGPFLYEHQPVEEDCNLCHDAHGTIANNLLKQNEPFLCLRCHRAHKGFEGTGSHPTLSTFLTSCTQCHSQVHGGDLPSQLGRGGLTR